MWGGIRDEKKPRLTLRIGATGNTGSYATPNISAHPIEGLVGSRSVDEANSALSRSGEIVIPSPTYEYLVRSLLLHEKLDYGLHNEWVEKDLEETTFVA